MRVREGGPYAFWCFAFVAFALLCAVAREHLGADYDFTRDGALSAHVTDRSLMPLLVTQNGAGNLIVLLAMAAAYWCAYGAYERIVTGPSLRFGCIAFAIGAVAAIALPILPTTDPYAYAMYAYESGPLARDPYVAQTFGGPWAHALLGIFPDATSLVRECQYGPFVPFLYGGLAIALQHASLLTFLLAERCLGVVAVILTALALALAAPDESRAERVRRAFAYALHPLAIFECIAFAHGDAIMVAELACAYAAWRRGLMWPAGVLCGLAICTRFVAIVALAALVVATLRRSRLDLYAAVSGAVVCVGVFAASSVMRFGDVSFGGQAVNYNPYSAPLNALTGLHLEEVAGAVGVAVLLYRAFRKGSDGLVWLPFAMLAGLPTLYANYFTWTLPVRALAKDPRVLVTARAIALVAPLTYVTHLDPFPAPGANVATQYVALGAVWIPVVVAFLKRPQVTTNSSR